MAKKKKNQDKETTIENYYDLKIDKVDELVDILKSGKTDDGKDVSMNIADCTGEESADSKTKSGKDKKFNPYSIDKLSRVPVWIKAPFIKWWFFGLVCYFVNMGLGVYITDPLDLLVIDGVLSGILTDCIVNPIFRTLASDVREYDDYMMFPFPFKAYWTFFTNLIYYVVVFVGVNYAYTGLNLLVSAIKPTWYIAVEPLLFGVVALVVDMALIGIKDLIVYLVKRAKANKENDLYD